MNIERIKELETTDATLTDDEKAEGWHFCPDWDYMLIGPGCDELDCCLCQKEI